MILFVKLILHFVQIMAHNAVANLWLKGDENNQRFRAWSKDNPQASIEASLHPLVNNVWSALRAGPYVSENGVAHKCDDLIKAINRYFLGELLVNSLILHIFLKTFRNANKAYNISGKFSKLHNGQALY